MGNPAESIAQNHGEAFTDQDLATIFQQVDQAKTGVSFTLGAEGRNMLATRLNEFLGSLKPVLAEGVTSEDVAKGLVRTFGGQVVGNNGMLKFFTEFDGANAHLNPEDAKAAAKRLGLKTTE